ncbi:hypothetical protein GCM10022220_65280 [Actinocatenispora rupis]|uniref:Uncharacterized protein n=1 Tax=Actinocatenispora rupis TaxID=519421 RepID=A0A8J3NE75_9ACTN|nr:hypothetical protein Aru02nite_66300 [Actinocatenispora rupis]
MKAVVPPGPTFGSIGAFGWPVAVGNCLAFGGIERWALDLVARWVLRQHCRWLPQPADLLTELRTFNPQVAIVGLLCFMPDVRLLLSKGLGLRSERPLRSDSDRRAP